jgi:hypothetical protein
VSFTIDTDEAETSRLSDAAWALARQIVRDFPSPNWPILPATIPVELAAEVRRLLNEMWFASALFMAATMEAGVSVNGVTVQFPAVVPYADASRLVSFETLLPFGMDPAEAKALAERFRGLAALCERVAGR